MKKPVILAVLVMLAILSSCGGVKPYYETRTGRKKQKFYNEIQYGHNAHPKKTWRD